MVHFAGMVYLTEMVRKNQLKFFLNNSTIAAWIDLIFPSKIAIFSDFQILIGSRIVKILWSFFFIGASPFLVYWYINIIIL